MFALNHYISVPKKRSLATRAFHTVYQPLIPVSTPLICEFSAAQAILARRKILPRVCFGAFFVQGQMPENARVNWCRPVREMDRGRAISRMIREAIGRFNGDFEHGQGLKLEGFIDRLEYVAY